MQVDTRSPEHASAAAVATAVEFLESIQVPPAAGEESSSLGRRLSMVKSCWSQDRTLDGAVADAAM